MALIAANRLTVTIPTGPDDPPADGDAQERIARWLEGEYGYRPPVERVEVSEELHYSTEDWLSLVFTHSNHVVLEPAAKTALRPASGRRPAWAARPWKSAAMRK